MGGAIGILRISSAYLLYASPTNIPSTAKQKNFCAKQNVWFYTRYFTTPAPPNNWLWYVVAEDRDGFHLNKQTTNSKSFSFGTINSTQPLLSLNLTAVPDRISFISQTGFAGLNRTVEL